MQGLGLMKAFGLELDVAGGNVENSKQASKQASKQVSTHASKQASKQVNIFHFNIYKNSPWLIKIDNI